MMNSNSYQKLPPSPAEGSPSLWAKSVEDVPRLINARLDLRNASPESLAGKEVEIASGGSILISYDAAKARSGYSPAGLSFHDKSDRVLSRVDRFINILKQIFQPGYKSNAAYVTEQLERFRIERQRFDPSTNNLEIRANSFADALIVIADKFKSDPAIANEFQQGHRLILSITCGNGAVEDYLVSRKEVSAIRYAREDDTMQFTCIPLKHTEFELVETHQRGRTSSANKIAAQLNSQQVKQQNANPGLAPSKSAMTRSATSPFTPPKAPPQTFHLVRDIEYTYMSIASENNDPTTIAEDIIDHINSNGLWKRQLAAGNPIMMRIYKNSGDHEWHSFLIKNKAHDNIIKLENEIKKLNGSNSTQSSAPEKAWTKNRLAELNQSLETEKNKLRPFRYNDYYCIPVEKKMEPGEFEESTDQNRVGTANRITERLQHRKSSI